MTFIKRPIFITAVIVFSAVISAAPQAATVSGGALILNLNRDAIIAGVDTDNYPDAPTVDFPVCCRPSLYVEEFYDASAASLNFAQLRDNNTPNLDDLESDEISAVGLHYAINGSSIAPNPGGRENRATDFTFDPNDLFGTATGSIGLGGVIRFRVDTTPPRNRILLGDMTLEYDAAEEGRTPGRSGWIITNHIGFDAGAFELFDVTTLLVGDTLTINGNLGFGWGFDHLGATDARLSDARIGTFSLQTTVVPLPAAAWLFLSGCAGLLFSGRAKKGVS
ncbi:MAG: hypothetical protein Q8N35_02420 [Methylococcaceae bacterium]|nr:hypothetical protein [Methylococcaceae bacterium]MDZ4156835.1 hypothetical protein [Methylococcales bacterium]MDP2391745.1 hypothetical protein [Methylococcaceae bacterium]MDP3018419.1 hypothetical protein [Methylococcaceae bacterium]MDP3389461.1 hypothetical protein [Methylococcaceae bacterium]